MEALYVPHFRTPVTYATRRAVGKFTSCRLLIVGLCISSFIPVFLSPPFILFSFIYFFGFFLCSFNSFCLSTFFLHFLFHFFIYSFPSLLYFLFPQSCFHFNLPSSLSLFLFPGLLNFLLLSLFLFPTFLYCLCLHLFPYSISLGTYFLFCSSFSCILPFLFFH